MLIGYTRVSSNNQSLARQVSKLKEFGCVKIFEEEQSKNNSKSRPVYQKLKSKLCFGNVLVVNDLSQFGSSKQEIKDEWEDLIKEEVDIVVLNMNMLDTRKYKGLEGADRLVSDIVLSLLSWMIDEEKERIRIAQREGIDVAKKQGKFRGRKRKYHAGAKGKDKVIYDEIVKELKTGTSVIDIHRKTGVARSTIYIIKKEV